jgi:hypothetical protein
LEGGGLGFAQVAGDLEFDRLDRFVAGSGDLKSRLDEDQSLDHRDSFAREAKNHTDVGNIAERTNGGLEQIPLACRDMFGQRSERNQGDRHIEPPSGCLERGDILLVIDERFDEMVRVLILADRRRDHAVIVRPPAERIVAVAKKNKIPNDSLTIHDANDGGVRVEGPSLPNRQGGE